MDLVQGLKERKSIRAFKPDPVPRNLIEEILDTARWSPSWGNTQPWELAVVGGEMVKRLTEAFVAAYEEKIAPNPDIPMPETWPDANKTRYMACAAGLFGTMGIGRDDRAGRLGHMINMTRGFGAPAIIYVLFDRNLNLPYAMLDMGSIIHAICLAAHHRGLGTCIEAQLALYPDIIRRHLKLPEGRQIVVGLALGYPDLNAPVNAFRTERESLDTFVSWTGY